MRTDLRTCFTIIASKHSTWKENSSECNSVIRIMTKVSLDVFQ